MMRTRVFYTLILLLLLSVEGMSQPALIRNGYKSEVGLPHLNIERSFVYTPDKAWMYSHHPHIAHFRDSFIVMWSNGMVDEDASGQRVVISRSNDFTHWSEPRTLASPSAYNDTLFNVLTAAGFHQYKDTLVAYYGEYSPKRTNTQLWARWSTDGLHWSEPIDLHLPVNPNHGPQATVSGRLIISGNFTFPYTDDPSGLRGWRMSSFYPDSLYREDNPATFYAPAERLQLPPLCEGSFFQTKDGVLHSLLRVTGKGWKGRLWQTESRNNGQSWSLPVEAPFSDNDSKFHFGRLPDRRYYYVGIPDTLHHYQRNPLVLSLSKDGKSFTRDYIIADSEYKLKKEGLWKGGQYGYPHTIIHQGYMYVIVSRQKEAIEVLRFNLNQL